MIGAEVKIKICGLSRPVDCDMVNRCQADFAGLVFAPGRRQVDEARAALLAGLLEPDILPVGVFVDKTPGQIAAIARQAGLAAIQLHCRADPEMIDSLRQLLPAQTLIWQLLAVPLDRPADQAGAEALMTAERFAARNILPDAWLLDSASQGLAGGTGLAFDWHVFSGIDLQRPVILAGGLNKDNVQAALQILRPAVVDTSSGVETDGYKDAEKIRLFCQAVRQSAQQNKPRS